MNSLKIPAVILAIFFSFAVQFVHAQTFDYSNLDSVLSKYVSEDGLVDYRGVKNDNALGTYQDAVKNFDPATLTDANEQLAFWINAYNAFTIVLIAKYYPLKSIMDIENKAGKNPWKIRFININGKKYHLDEIEKDIIIPEFEEPRIHYALVCAAVSCPKLRNEAYLPSKLEEQLEEQARNFLNDEDRNRLDRKKKRMYVSKIFDWYTSDFENADGTLINHFLKYINESDKEFIINSEVSKISYLNYSWKLNDLKK